ncbi:MAG: C1 family peptidase [Nitrospira sp. BO4]|nr:C1 family peptidase [Nitrospira sp. BO4]
MPTSKMNVWYGWVPDRPDQRDKLYAAIAGPPRTLPSKVDLRDGCSPVENQGQLGSCTANALVGNLEFLEKRAGHNPTNLSRLFIYYNERAMEGTIREDAGAMIRDGVKSLVKLGVCTEKLWPYKIARFTKKPSQACYKQARNRQVTSYHRVIGLQQMKQCLAEGYPFVFGFSVYEAFESPQVAKTGQLDLPKPSEKQIGGHAVLAVGYDEQAQRILVRNSWGADWGIQGYFTMPYDYISNDNLADDFWTLRMIEDV